MKKRKKQVRENVIQKVSSEMLMGDLCNAPLPRPAHLSHQFPSPRARMRGVVPQFAHTTYGVVLKYYK